MLEDKKLSILVTGSSGYLGRNFINKFKSKFNFKKFSILKENINNIDFNDIDVILHCAALVHQKDNLSYEEYYNVNVEYPVSLAKIAKQNGLKHFIFVSSISVYGDDLEIISENTVCRPATNYGKSKLEAEKKLLSLNCSDFLVSVVRPPMIYGENAPGNIDRLVKLVKKLPIMPFGRIENKRSFIFIQNLCYVIDEIISQQKSGIFLASDDEPVSTSRLIELIAKNLDKKIYLIKIPFFETLLKIVKLSFHKRLYGSLEVDNNITKEKLNLSNPYSVEDGIRLMIEGEDSPEQFCGSEI